MITDPGIYFVRHGETDYDAADIMQGWHDGPLNEKGKQQAAEVAQRLKDLPMGRVYSSDLFRAMETAAKFVPPEIGGQATAILRTVALRPWNIGGLVGKPDPNYELVKSFIFEREDEPVTDGISDGEPWKDFYTRFMEHVRRSIVQFQADATNVVHVTHSWNMRLLNAATYGDSDCIVDDIFPLGSIARLWHDGADWQFKLCQ